MIAKLVTFAGMVPPLFVILIQSSGRPARKIFGEGQLAETPSSRPTAWPSRGLQTRIRPCRARYPAMDAEKGRIRISVLQEMRHNL